MQVHEIDELILHIHKSLTFQESECGPIYHYVLEILFQFGLGSTVPVANSYKV